MTAQHPTLVVGFDALDFEYLDRFSDSLPNFRRFRSRGVTGELRSTLPPWTGSAWPSMYTGTDPSHHGVYDFFAHDGYPDEATIASRNDVDRPALWNYLTAADRTSVVLNLPVTHPAEDVEGAIVPGYLATEDTAGSPETVRDDLSEAIGDRYRIYARTETASDGEAKLDGYLDLIDMRARAAEALLTEYDWDLGIVQVQKTDAVFHNFEDHSAFRRVYQAADDFLGRVLETVPDDVNVVVCSDHGIGHKDGYAIYLNEILREHGYVEGTTDGEESSFASVKSDLTMETDGAENGSTGALERAVPAATAGLRRLGIEPADVYSAADRLGAASVLDRVVPTGAKAASAETVDWRASRAYCRSNAELGVRINLAGREPEGVVPREEYETVRDDLIDLLRGIETPDGKPAFERVCRREAVYDGPHAEEACDVIVVPAGMNHKVGTKLFGRPFVPIDLYDHERDGVFLAAGPDVESGATVEGLSLVDVAPLVMTLLGEPVPDRMTGTVPADVVDRPVETADYGNVSFGEGATTGDEGAVTDRLEDLGYL